MPKQSVYKHVFQIVVLNECTDYDPDDLMQLAYDITDGDSIGQYSKLSTDSILPRQVRTELIAIANDGTFFEPS